MTGAGIKHAHNRSTSAAGNGVPPDPLMAALGSQVGDFSSDPLNFGIPYMQIPGAATACMDALQGPLGLKTNCDSLCGFGLKTYLFRQDYN